MASLFSEPGMCSCFVAAGGLLEPGACCDEAPVLVTILIEVMNPVTIYTADPCARCGTAKALLARNGIVFAEVNLSKDPDGRAELFARTGLRTFPQIVIGKTTVGGLADL